MGHTNGWPWVTGQSSMFSLSSTKYQLLKWLLTFRIMCSTTWVCQLPWVCECNCGQFNLCKEWSGEVTIVYGGPRNPKCHGLFEQGN